MKIFIAFFMCAVLVSVTYGSTPEFGSSVDTESVTLDPKIKEKIDNYIQDIFLPQNHIPGLSLAIVYNNTNYYVRGYGLKNVERNESVDENTLFGIGSVTKSFTATLAVKALHDQFPELETSLDTPIRKLVPSYDLSLGDEYRNEQTTFRDLLSHRLCMDAKNQLSFFSVPFIRREDGLKRLRYSKEKCGFRSELTYNNDHYTLVGDIAAKMLNASSYEESIQSLFDSLGMNDTTLVTMKDKHDDIPSRSQLYSWKENAFQPFSSELLKIVAPANPAGGILSSANDMARYLKFHLSKGKVDGNEVLPQKVVEQLYKSSIVYETPREAKRSDSDVVKFTYSYALGLANGVYDGWKIISHAGYLPLYETLLSFYPELGLGIYTSTNGPGLIAQKGRGHADLHWEILSTILGKDNRKPTPEQGEKTPSLNSTQLQTDNQTLDVPTDATHTLTNHTSADSNEKIVNTVVINETTCNIQELAGHYGSLLNGDMTLSTKETPTDNTTSLYMDYGYFGQAWLQPIGNCTFALKWDSLLSTLADTPEGSFIKFEVKFEDMEKLLVYPLITKSQPIQFDKGLNSTEKVGESSSRSL